MKKGRRKITPDMEISAEAQLGELSGGFRLSEKIDGAMRSAAGLLSKYRLLIIRTVIPAVYCLLFGGVGFEMGIYPFGVAAVCAMQAGASAFIGAAAVAVSSLFVRGGFYIALPAALGAASLALVAKLRPTADTPVFRGILAAVVGVIQVTSLSISDGVSFYEVYGGILAATLCPIFTVSLGGLFRSDGRTAAAAEVGIYAILYTAVYSLRLFSYTGESAATVISMTAALYAVYAFGTRTGALAGAVVGLAAEPVYGIIYAAAALASGVLMNISVIGAVLAGVLVALSLGFRGAGASAFGELFPEFMMCAAVAAPLFHYGIVPTWREKERSQDETACEINEVRLQRTKDRLHALSEGLGVVSCTMRRMSKIFSRPTEYEMRQICDNAFDESCTECAERSECWEREYRATSAAVSSIAKQARSGKSVSISALPEGMRDRCPYLGGIVSRINIGAASAVRTAAENDRTAAASESYGTVSRLIDEVNTAAERELEVNERDSAALSERFLRIGLGRADVRVYGDRRRIVTASGIERGCTVTGEELRDAASSVLGCAMSAPKYRITGKSVSFEMHTAERFTATLGRFSVAKRGERCGDSIASFAGSGGYSYTLISDGMGSGGEAALTSGACALFLERMLGAGCGLGASMEMLNNFLRGRNLECFTTVDLLEADLITGELRFVKSGAAPSFVLREGKLFKLSSKTVPVGIVAPYDAEQIKFNASAGDHVIMLSDGVVPDGEDPAWLYDMLGDRSLITDGCNLADAAKRIANAAAEKTAYADDVTVGVVRIGMV